MRVVVFSPADSFTETSLPVLSPDETVVVCWRCDTAEDIHRIALPRDRVADRIARACSANALLRTLLRLSRFDPGAAFWRAAKRSPEVARAAMAADLLVAPERDGAFAAWNALRLARRASKNPVAVSGYAAARVAIDRMR